MNFEKLAAMCFLSVATIALSVSYCIKGGYPLLMAAALFLTAELFLLGLGDRTQPAK